VASPLSLHEKAWTCHCPDPFAAANCDSPNPGQALGLVPDEAESLARVRRDGPGVALRQRYLTLTSTFFGGALWRFFNRMVKTPLTYSASTFSWSTESGRGIERRKAP